MNILQEEDTSTSQLQKCKTLYLQKENRWMEGEVKFINELIAQYKRMIQAKGEQGETGTIERVRQEIREAVEKKKEEYRELREREEQKTEENITEDEFISIVQSYEEKVYKLQRDIKERQMQLQVIEQSKREEDFARPRNYDMKFLNSVQIHGKFIDRIRRQNHKLRIKKKHLQNQLIAIKEQSKEEDSTTMPTRISKPKVKRMQSNDEEISTFEKTLLLLKKKKFTNDLLEEKIAKMKSKILEKKHNSQHIQKQIDKLEWNCLQNMQSCHGYVDSNYGDMSMLDRTAHQNNLSFSLNISQFIKLPPCQR